MAETTSQQAQDAQHLDNLTSLQQAGPAPLASASMDAKVDVNNVPNQDNPSLYNNNNHPKNSEGELFSRPANSTLPASDVGNDGRSAENNTLVSLQDSPAGKDKNTDVANSGTNNAIGNVPFVIPTADNIQADQSTTVATLKSATVESNQLAPSQTTTASVKDLLEPTSTTTTTEVGPTPQEPTDPVDPPPVDPPPVDPPPVDPPPPPPPPPNELVDGNETAQALYNTTITGNLLDNVTQQSGESYVVVEVVINGQAYTLDPDTPYTSVIITGVGEFAFSADGYWAFTPNTDYWGAIPQVDYTVFDGDITDTSTLVINPIAEPEIEEPEEPPVIPDNGNNGHGNNTDGEDDSNPGQGSGGPNDNKDTVDEDEAGLGNTDDDNPGSEENGQSGNIGQDDPVVDPVNPSHGNSGGPQGNNGIGNGDQDAPGGSLDNNNAENDQDDTSLQDAIDAIINDPTTLPLVDPIVDAPVTDTPSAWTDTIDNTTPVDIPITDSNWTETVDNIDKGNNGNGKGPDKTLEDVLSEPIVDVTIIDQPAVDAPGNSGGHGKH